MARRRGSGNGESNCWLEEKFQEGKELEAKLAKVRLGLDSVLLRTRSYRKDF
jgi:hypothetical protein